MSELRIFVGYDTNEPVAYHVCVDSIIRHATRPLSITPLALSTLPYEERHGDGSTQFAYTRFLAPYLSGFRGLSLFLDGDMVVRDDIGKLFDIMPIGSAVCVVKHPEYTPKYETKFRNQEQRAYPKKNWSSVMLFQNSSSFCQQLTPEYVSNASGAHLHQFEWLPEDRIGELPAEWNHLVGQYEHNDDAKILHYTDGIPPFRAYTHCDHAPDWIEAFNHMRGVSE